MKVYKPLSIGVFFIIISVIFSCTKITGEEATAEQPTSFQITDGACGEVTFEEKVGTDSLSAVETVRQRKVEFFGHNNFSIESTVVEVEGENGKVPNEKFYALHVLDEDSLHLHSVSEVITNEGNLYILDWCTD